MADGHQAESGKLAATIVCDRWGVVGFGHHGRHRYLL